MSKGSPFYLSVLVDATLCISKSSKYSARFKKKINKTAKQLYNWHTKFQILKCMVWKLLTHKLYPHNNQDREHIHYPQVSVCHLVIHHSPRQLLICFLSLHISQLKHSISNWWCYLLSIWLIVRKKSTYKVVSIGEKNKLKKGSF